METYKMAGNAQTVYPQQSGANARAGFKFDMFKAPQKESKPMLKQESATIIPSAIERNNLQRIIDEFIVFLHSYPKVVDEFLEVFNYRARTAGFPEYAHVDRAMSIGIRAMFFGGATEQDLEQAEIISGKTILWKRTSGTNLSLSHQEYLRATSGELGLLCAVEIDIIDGFVAEIIEQRKPVTTVILAMHLEFIRKRDWIA
jgi:hypothetical protein